ncbi:hypothetical protein [Microvirga sp. Mcv34]|uniref:hypothetical protein n=1 Tax=Microvirga sp. Mcv34 TaxID=2926016 RepID=UPI0021C63D80|nr:hypothetical protein [Microvirga sp. Mcv34]
MLTWLVLALLPPLLWTLLLGSLAGFPWLDRPKRFLIFIVLGPPLGGLVSCIAVMLTGDPPNPHLLLQNILFLSYIPGLAPALLTALIARQLQRWNAPHEGAWVCAVGALSGLVSISFVNVLFGWSLRNTSIGEFAVSAIIGLIPSLICWWIAKRLARQELREMAR